VTPQEANKIIAVFIGYRHDGTKYDDMVLRGRYESLDALVPVWMTIGKIPKDFDNGRHWDIDCFFEESIQEAACIATAKAIQALEASE